MSISFTVKHTIGSWRMFIALLLGVTLASTFFSGINIGADMVVRQALNKELNRILVDMRINLYGFPLYSTQNVTDIMRAISEAEVEGLKHMEVMSSVRVYKDKNVNFTFRVVGVQNSSNILKGLNLGANESYIWSGSPNASEIKVGDVIRFNFTVKYYRDVYSPPVEKVTVKLTVKGSIELDERTYEILTGGTQMPYGWREWRGLRLHGENLLIVDWNKTLAPVINLLYTSKEVDVWVNPNLETRILIFIDRDLLINPWDIDGTINRLRIIEEQIRNIVSTIHLSSHVWNSLYWTLYRVRMEFQGMRMVFLMVSLPVFFIAWYMGTTVSDVSYNLRRREIGLLLSKGFSRRQLLAMFLTEALLIGSAGGLIGIALGILLAPIFTQVYGGGAPTYDLTAIVGGDTALMTFGFSVILALLSVFQPARRASKLDIVEALQEYRYVEEVKPYRRRWPWVAFLLGAYKMAVWLLGVNTFTILMRPPPTTNVLLLIILSVWIIFDNFVLNYIGPFLFLWGVTKILIRGSLKFQEFITKVAKFTGDLGVLATKQVRRNPARAASVAFLVAMIVGYSFQVVGSYASERDFLIRHVRFTVGADVSVFLSREASGSAESVIEAIMGNVSGISSVTVEYKFGVDVGGRWVSVVAIDPDEWFGIAYYEPDLFTGRDVASAIHEMEGDNYTIILERGVAGRLKLSIDDPVAVTPNSKTLNLRIVGFFGPKSVAMQHPYYYPHTPSYWSYIPVGLYHIIEDEVKPQVKILIKLEPGVDGKLVAEDIRNLRLSEVDSVYSVAEMLEAGFGGLWMHSVPYVPFSGVAPSISMEIQRFGIAFMIVAASIGVALSSIVGVRERVREIGILSVRGLSFRQIVGMLLTESLAVNVFSILLGAAVGLIVVHGSISASNSIWIFTTPIPHRMVFPLDAVLTLTSCCCLVIISTVIPTVISAGGYMKEIERIVREV